MQRLKLLNNSLRRFKPFQSQQLRTVLRENKRVYSGGDSLLLPVDVTFPRVFPNHGYPNMLRLFLTPNLTINPLS